MRQHQLVPPPGSTHVRKRVGRGYGSGHGTTAGKGTKGQNARTGGGVRPGFEGGQLPIIKRLPRIRGFKNIFKIEYAVVNVGDLNGFDGVVDAPVLAAAGLIPNARRLVKVLGHGELTKNLTVKAKKFSASAKAKIAAAGGSVEEK
ncbi:MAG: 50S ribosomal protein L15 [Dehalococcoidia bacterium]|nr:50S ribosomal protein L15 [Dehalococcoidia bacterium]